MSHAAPSVDGRPGQAPTPFYDNLMSMIEATALERGQAARADADVAASGSHRPWRIRLLALGVAGVAVIVVVGRGLLVPDVSQTRPPAATADAGNAREEQFRAGDAAATADGSAQRRPPVAEQPGRPEAADGGLRTAEGRAGAGVAVAAKPEEPPATTSVAVQPIESLGPGAETEGGGPAGAPASGDKAEHTDAIAEAAAPPGAQPLPSKAPPSPSPAIETGSVERAGDPASVRVARMVSDANMRAGPSNGQAVLTTIARGRTVEVIGCRAWCEVIFAGQRGWIYKGFIDTSPSSAGR